MRVRVHVCARARVCACVEGRERGREGERERECVLKLSEWQDSPSSGFINSLGPTILMTLKCFSSMSLVPGVLLAYLRKILLSHLPLIA